MALMSLRSRSHIKASMVSTRADHLFIHNYIRSLLNIMLRPIFYRKGFEPASYCNYVILALRHTCVSDALSNMFNNNIIYI